MSKQHAIPSLSSRVKLILYAAVFCCALSGQVWAQDVPICTTDPSFVAQANAPGIVSTIATNIQNILANISRDMFQGIETDSNFQSAVGGLLTLYVAIYGIVFMFGMVPVTAHDFIVRMIKLSLVSLLASGTAWSLFDQYVVQFFTKGTDELINTVTSIAVGGATGVSPGPPLSVLDSAIGKLLSANMIVHLIAMMGTGVYWIHTFLLFIAMWSFLWSLLTGMWIYLMSMVLRTLLFGVAPIFLACLLFDRTKPLFTGWLNQVVCVCLQPILLFTFLSFFILLVNATMDNVTSEPVCWTDVPGSEQGTSFDHKIWRFLVSGLSDTEEVVHGWDGPANTADTIDPANTPIFPVDIMVILIFFILAELSRQFNQIVLMIAKDLAVGGIDLAHMRGALQGIFQSAAATTNADGVGLRRDPGGMHAPISDKAASEGIEKGKGVVSELVDRASNMVTPRK